jgi:GLTT repeat (6 copies)
MTKPLDSAFLGSLLACAALCVACEPAAPPEEELGLSPSALASDNGIATNGIATNGIATNGLAPNALDSNRLSVNGLAAAGVAASEFAAWFGKDTAYANMVMKFVVQCALPHGGSLSYRRSEVTYVWAGDLGLAPVWSSGQPIPLLEQQLLTACLAAHTNRFGRHISISVRGVGTDGQPIAVSPTEDVAYRFSEACYFGNLFANEGVFMALGSGSLDPAVTTPRGCAAEAGAPTSCSPVAYAGTCAAICNTGPDGKTLGDCVANGVHYLPLQVFLLDQDVYRCGDGVCQFTESHATCPADCN